MTGRGGGILAAAALTVVLSGTALRAADSLADMAADLADRYQLHNDAILIADAESHRSLLCLVRIEETGDSMITDHAADLLCRGRVAGWQGENRWIRITGMTEVRRSETGHRTLVLFGFENGPGQGSLDEAAATRYLQLALAKAPSDVDTAPSIDVRSGRGGKQ